MIHTAPRNSRASHSRAGHFGLMIAALLGIVPVAGHAASAARIIVYPIDFIDTSHEPGDQAADHARRTQIMAAAASDELGRQAATTSEALAADTVQARCPTRDTDCLLGIGKAAGATAIAVVTVHKVSSLIMNMSLRLVDPQTNRSLLEREMSFRSDSDDAWRRAGKYLAGEIEDGLASPRS